MLQKGNRLVEAPSDPLDDFPSGVLAGDDLGRIAWDEPDHGEDDKRDAEQDRNRQEEPPNKVGPHRSNNARGTDAPLAY